MRQVRTPAISEIAQQDQYSYIVTGEDCAAKMHMGDPAAFRKFRDKGVHPIAELFPMMTNDELNDLAVDIKEHGQLHPIIADDEGLLIDGRNRAEACSRAGVEPWIEGLNGHDAVALIISANLTRRNLTKGQKAMALALIHPEPEKGGRGKKGKASETDGFSSTRLKQARSVLAFSRELAGKRPPGQGQRMGKPRKAIAGEMPGGGRSPKKGVP